jgi:hypothetical protein
MCRTPLCSNRLPIRRYWIPFEIRQKPYDRFRIPIEGIQKVDKRYGQAHNQGNHEAAGPG